MTDQDGNPRPITKGTIEGDKLSLTVASEWQGFSVNILVEGRIDGNTIKLKLESKQGGWSADATVKRR